MKMIKSIDNIRVATIGKFKAIATYIVSTPDPSDLAELVNEGWLDGYCLEDSDYEFKHELLKTPGFYAGTLEFWFEEGYMDGYPAPGESSIYIKISNARKLEIHDPEITTIEISPDNIGI